MTTCEWLFGTISCLTVGMVLGQRLGCFPVDVWDVRGLRVLVFVDMIGCTSDRDVMRYDSGTKVRGRLDAACVRLMGYCG